MVPRKKTTSETSYTSITMFNWIGIISKPTLKHRIWICRFEKPHLISQWEFHDLVRDLGLSKTQTVCLRFTLKQWIYLPQNVSIRFRRTGNTGLFGSLFTESTENSNLAYWNDVIKLLEQLWYSHVPQDWQLFIDASTKRNINICYIVNLFRLYIITFCFQAWKQCLCIMIDCSILYHWFTLSHQGIVWQYVCNTKCHYSRHKWLIVNR